MNKIKTYNPKKQRRTRNTQRMAVSNNIGMVPRKQFSTLSPTLTKVINLSYEVFACYNYISTSSFYSFSGSTSVGLNQRNVIADLAANPEFLAFTNQYAYFKFGQVNVQLDSTFRASANVVDLPNIFLNISSMTTPSNATPLGIARSDNSFEVKMFNTNSVSAMCAYNLPPVLSSAAGYNIGSSVWNQTGTTSWTNAFLNLFLGSLTAPSFTGLATSSSFRVGVVHVKIPVIFGAPMIQN